MNRSPWILSFTFLISINAFSDQENFLPLTEEKENLIVSLFPRFSPQYGNPLRGAKYFSLKDGTDLLDTWNMHPREQAVYKIDYENKTATPIGMPLSRNQDSSTPYYKDGENIVFLSKNRNLTHGYVYEGVGLMTIVDQKDIVVKNLFHGEHYYNEDEFPSCSRDELGKTESGAIKELKSSFVETNPDFRIVISYNTRDCSTQKTGQVTEYFNSIGELQAGSPNKALKAQPSAAGDAASGAP